MIIDAVKLSQDLIRCASVTPEDEGALSVLEKALDSLGFACHRLPFTSNEDPNLVDNLYARFGKKEPNLCYAGHTDVVPVGGKWKHDPFEAKIVNGVLYGRGAVDMKPAIAAWVAATSEFLRERKGKFNGSISLLITGDEEGLARNGTRKVLEWMKKKKENINDCIVGEPTNVKKIGDTIKIGRRGSMIISLTVDGIQGHAAYPQLADNPVTPLIKILNELKNHKLDNGNKYFQASNLEVTSVDVGNSAWNVIPAAAHAKINIRFNDVHTSKQLAALVDKVCSKYTKKYKLDVRVTGEAFINKSGTLAKLVEKSVKKITKITPGLSTSGGTSDARFIKDVCPVVEFGLINKTAHKVDEHVAVADIIKLKKVYKEVLDSYF